MSFALHDKKSFRLTKICKKGRKDHIFVSLHMFPFYGIIIFLKFLLNENVRKQHLSASTYSWVNIKFSYTIGGLTDEIFMLYGKEKKQFFASF